ncbi:MAG: Holliday junction resolvase RuvX [Bdellovibrionota bacterium]
MSLIALDWGQRFVGYASSDPNGVVITPRGFFERKVGKANTWVLTRNDILSLEKIIEEWEVEKLLLGLPLRADGGESPASINARGLRTMIEEHFNIQVGLVDERLTSWESKGKDNHAQAAALILQNYFRVGEMP